MIDLSDLGLTPETSAATDAPAMVASNDNHGPKGLVPGSMLARVLYAAFSRQPVTIVDSPPGAGKTTLVVDTLAQLLGRSDFDIVVACPTRRGAIDLAGRLAAELGDAESAPAVVLGLKGALVRPKGVFATKPPTKKREITVRTIKSCAVNPPTCDVLVFDEAYQATFSDVAAAADGAEQVMMVGDPGQIGPVVTQRTSAWERRRNAPHHRAPEVFARRSDAQVLQMDATYRLGADTVAAIAPLYGFPFVSKRPDRHLITRAGTRLPELAAARIAPSTSISDLAPMEAVARLAMSMVGSTVVTHDEDGNAVEKVLRQGDVAVVVSHNVQASGVQAILRSEVYDNITVGTADRMQGGQWHAVVALDPLVGHGTVSPHQLNKGRLCVMASRHMTHLTWVGDGQEFDKLQAAVEEHPEAKAGIAVRRHLLADLPPLATPAEGAAA